MIPEAPAIDRLGRPLNSLRISVIDRCDLRCAYCMPEEHYAWLPQRDILTFEEIEKLVDAFTLAGVRKVRLTGGEPLLRQGLVELVARLRQRPRVEELAITTNATRLAQLAAPLRRAGLDRVTASLDSLRPERFKALVRRDALGKVVEGIRAAAAAGFSGLKINTVVMRGFNDDELGDLVDFAWARGFTPRFIELMPIGEGARVWPGTFLPWGEVVARLGDRVVAKVEPARPQESLPRGPARYLPSPDDPRKRVGFISAMTSNFCEGCNRVRVTARGEMRACLASPSGVDLRAQMRLGASDAEIVAAVQLALWGKAEGHDFQAAPTTRRSEHVHMSGVGG